jgi:hypothetical protein
VRWMADLDQVVHTVARLVRSGSCESSASDERGDDGGEGLHCVCSRVGRKERGINESVWKLKGYAEEAVAESFERWMMRRSTCWSCEERCLIPSRIQAFSHDVHCCNGYTRVVLDRGFR